MQRNFKFLFNTFITFLSILVATAVIAEPKIELNEETVIKNKEIQLESVKVLVNYTPSNSDDNNVFYKIFYNDIQCVEDKEYSKYMGYIELQDLDSDSTPEIIVSTFSGGAHCCTNFLIYSWQKDRFVKNDLGSWDGNGGSFIDLDKDGKYEFVTNDNAFLYTFSSYAASFPPLLIYTFSNGKLENTTRKYRNELKTRAWEMYTAFLESKKDNYDVNGILAGYVAQKILLGEYEEGWKFMLVNYDRKSDWGLEIYKDENVIGKYPNFPTALKAFLIETKYLDKNGNPFN